LSCRVLFFPQYENKLRGTLVALAPNEGLVTGKFPAQVFTPRWQAEHP
jgi:hypothetical protein